MHGVRGEQPGEPGMAGQPWGCQTRGLRCVGLSATCWCYWQRQCCAGCGWLPSPWPLDSSYPHVAHGGAGRPLAAACRFPSWLHQPSSCSLWSAPLAQGCGAGGGERLMPQGACHSQVGMPPPTRVTYLCRGSDGPLEAGVKVTPTLACPGLRLAWIGSPTGSPSSSLRSRPKAGDVWGAAPMPCPLWAP